MSDGQITAIVCIAVISIPVGLLIWCSWRITKLKDDMEKEFNKIRRF